jgi:hypothetical protein
MILSAAFVITAREEGKDWQTKFEEDKTDLTSTGENPYFILEPGYQLVLEMGTVGVTTSLIITVLDETKVVDGVETRVVEERKIRGGELAKISLNYFAISSKTDNVYLFGEQITKFKNGESHIAESSWEAGVNDARFGMILPGRPEVGMKFSRKQAPMAAKYHAEVMSLSETVHLPAGSFENCLKIQNSTPQETGGEAPKLYAPGVGLVSDGDLMLVRYGHVGEKS